MVFSLCPVKRMLEMSCYEMSWGVCVFMHAWDREMRKRKEAGAKGEKLLGIGCFWFFLLQFRRWLGTAAGQVQR